MQNLDLASAFSELSTPLIADAGLRRNIPVRFAPAGIISLLPGKQRIAGRALPVRHFGSVDVFLEALGHAETGDVMVIDNGGRHDEGCIGDLTVLEAQAHKLAGMVVWGLHRDTDELLKIGFPVFSYGGFPPGPGRLDPRESDTFVTAHFGDHHITRDDVVFGDADGVLFVAASDAAKLIEVACTIQLLERRQAENIIAGQTLREQFKFENYLAQRRENPSLTFRQYLRSIGGAIEE